MKKVISCKHNSNNTYSTLSNPRQIQCPQQRSSPNATSLFAPSFYLPLISWLPFTSTRAATQWKYACSSEVNLREAFHTQYSSLGGSLIYSEYCIASKVDNCYFVEYILGLKTNIHSLLTYRSIIAVRKDLLIYSIYLLNLLNLY